MKNIDENYLIDSTKKIEKLKYDSPFFNDLHPLFKKIINENIQSNTKKFKINLGSEMKFSLNSTLEYY